MRIILITAFTLIATGILILTARIWGLGQTHPPFNHNFFTDSKPLLILRVDSLAKADEAVALQSDVVLWLDVRFSRDKILFVLPTHRDLEFLDQKRREQEAQPNTPIMIGGKISEYRFEDIETFFKNVPTLKSFYDKFPNSRFVLNVIDNVSDAHFVLTQALQNLNPDQRTLIQSDALILMTSIKELKPEWVYGTSVPDIVRLLTFDSMLILPTTQFKGDVFIAPFQIAKRPAYNEDIIQEMRRRKKRIFLGPIETEAQFAEASRLRVDGYITRNLTELKRLLGQGPVQ